MTLAGRVVAAGVVAVVAACAHSPNLPLRPDPSPPAGSTTWTFKAHDGTELLARTWPADPAALAAHHNLGAMATPENAAAIAAANPPSPLGVVVIMHGLKDYAARYDTFAKLLASHGYVVYAFDLRGHGRSAGPRVAPDRWTDYVDDLDRFLKEVEHREQGAKIYLFGHSMGGAIATLTAEVHRPKLAGLILSGPALAVDGPPLQIAAAVMAGVLSPGFGALKLDNHDFSSDPANAAVMDKDELIENGPGPAKTVAGLIDGMRQIWAGTDELTMPVLAMHGTADKLTAPWGSLALVRRLQHHDATFLKFDGYNHDLLHEPNGHGDQVANLVVGWIDLHVAGGAGIEHKDIADRDTTAITSFGDLAGRPRGWSQSVLVAAGVDHANGYAFAGELDLDIVRPKPFGWYGNLEARLGDTRAIALRPLGIAVAAPHLTLGIAAGAALTSGTQFALSGKWWFNAYGIPLVHLDGFFTFDRTFDRGMAGFDEVRYGGALRMPSDKYYWPRARAGVGPVFLGGQDCARSVGGQFACGWFALLGLELFGTD